MKRIYVTAIAMMLVASVIGYGQRGSQSPAIDPPVHTVRMDGTLRIQLNGAVKDWLFGANVAPAGATARVQVFEIDRDYRNAAAKDGGQGFAKAVSYPPVIVLSNTAQVNDVGSHDTTTVYVEAPAWTTIVITGPKEEVLYQTPLRKTLLVSRGLEFTGSNIRDVRSLLPTSEWTGPSPAVRGPFCRQSSNFANPSRLAHNFELSSTKQFGQSLGFEADLRVLRCRRELRHRREGAPGSRALPDRPHAV